MIYLLDSPCTKANILERRNRCEWRPDRVCQTLWHIGQCEAHGALQWHSISRLFPPRLLVDGATQPLAWEARCHLFVLVPLCRCLSLAGHGQLVVAPRDRSVCPWSVYRPNVCDCACLCGRDSASHHSVRTKSPVFG